MRREVGTLAGSATDGGYTLADGLFRTLTPNEEAAFRQWARENATPEHFAKAGLYHPVVRDEWWRMGCQLLPSSSPSDP